MDERKKKYIVGDIYIVESDIDIVFGNKHIELCFSRCNGQLYQIVDPVKNDVVAGGTAPNSTIELWEGGEPDATKAPYDGYCFDDIVNQNHWQGDTRFIRYKYVQLMNGVVCHISFGDDRWQVEQIVTIKPDDTIVRIEWALKYLGEQETKLRNVQISLPVIGDWAECVELPKVSLAPSLPIEEFVDRADFSSVAGVHDNADNRSLYCWIHNKDLTTGSAAIKVANTLQWQHTYFNSGIFKTGTILKFGKNYIALNHGSWADCLDLFSDWTGKSCSLLDGCVCPWAREAVIWEAHVGTITFAPDYDYAPYPTLADFKKDLPRIKDLGFNTIQLMPQMPLPGYCVYYYENMSQTYGGESDEELKTFFEEANDLGFRVILDIVLHGVVDGESGVKGDQRYTIRNRFFQHWAKNAHPVHQYRLQHPEWFRLSETGEIDYIHTWLFDFSQPGLCDFIVSHLRRCLTEFDVDGFRFDCPEWGSSPNWASDYPYWPANSQKAVIHALRKARTQLNDVKPDILWYTEPSHADYGVFMDMTYAYEEDWLWEALGKIITARGYCPTGTILKPGLLPAKAICQWLEQRRAVMPQRNMVIQHHLDSHDTWWQNEKAMFRKEAFGPQVATTLVAFAALMDGAFLTFVGAERGQEVFYKQLLTVRHSLPALRRGRCDYTGINCDCDRVIALWRQYQAEWAIPVINFSDKTVECNINMEPAELTIENGMLMDYMSESVVVKQFDNENFKKGFCLSLEPYQVMVLAPKR